MASNGQSATDGRPDAAESTAPRSRGDCAGEIRIGFYICHCGRNIAGVVDCGEVARHIGRLPDVVVSRDYKYMCSEPGQRLLQQDIREFGLNRVVVASCSPLLHEHTFRRATAAAGLNPFLFQMVNIREHASWVHPDRDAATAKAQALAQAAVKRVARHEALEVKRVPIHPDVLVVGGGIAGIEAALTIADAGRKVFLVERAPSIGGHMAGFDKTFPTLDCAACILTPKMSAVGAHPNITLLSHSEVAAVNGYVGNYRVSVRRKARYVDETKCTGCLQCIERCPVHYQAYPVAKTSGDGNGGAHGLPLEPELEPETRRAVENALAQHGAMRAPLIAVLQDINRDLGYLPEPALRDVSRRLRVPLVSVYHVATFYKAFSLLPRGRHLLRVCLGTACHVRGAQQVLESIKGRLHIEPGQTTPDRSFTLETVNCLGACALAPVITIDQKYSGNMTAPKVEPALKPYGAAQAKAKEVAQDKGAGD